MEYMLFLNKFELDAGRFKSKIKALDKNASFQDEDKNLIIKSSLDHDKLMRFQEISKLIVLYSEWKDFSFKTLKEDCLILCREFKIKTYSIEIKFHDKVKISSKSIYRHINPYLKYENILFNEESDILYIEFKKFDNKLKYRLGYSNQYLFNKVNAVKVDMKNFIVVLENPILPLEVGDFLRLCWIFKLPLHIITKDKDFDKILKKAKEDTKGIDYDKFDLRITKELPKDYLLVGFSKYADKNEKDMKDVILSNKKIALIFGDNKYGLTQEIRDKLDYCFRLTPELKKPLRASQALSYILGFYTAYKI